MTSAPQAERPTIILHLRPEPHVADADRMLRRALKVLLRRFGLRCVDMREEQAS